MDEQPLTSQFETRPCRGGKSLVKRLTLLAVSLLGWPTRPKGDCVKATNLTVLIPCKNERRNIRRCIESVREIATRLQRGYSALTMQLHRLREILADCVGRKVRNLEFPA